MSDTFLPAMRKRQQQPPTSHSKYHRNPSIKYFELSFSVTSSLFPLNLMFLLISFSVFLSVSVSDPSLVFRRGGSFCFTITSSALYAPRCRSGLDHIVLCQGLLFLSESDSLAVSCSSPPQSSNSSHHFQLNLNLSEENHMSEVCFYAPYSIMFDLSFNVNKHFKDLVFLFFKLSFLATAQCVKGCVMSSVAP